MCKQRAKGFGPSTSSLGSWRSTAELRPHKKPLTSYYIRLYTIFYCLSSRKIWLRFTLQRKFSVKLICSLSRPDIVLNLTFYRNEVLLPWFLSGGPPLNLVPVRVKVFSNNFQADWFRKRLIENQLAWQSLHKTLWSSPRTRLFLFECFTAKIKSFANVFYLTVQIENISENEYP